MTAVTDTDEPAAITELSDDQWHRVGGPQSRHRLLRHPGRPAPNAAGTLRPGGQRCLDLRSASGLSGRHRVPRREGGNGRPDEVHRHRSRGPRHYGQRCRTRMDRHRLVDPTTRIAMGPGDAGRPPRTSRGGGKSDRSSGVAFGELHHRPGVRRRRGKLVWQRNDSSGRDEESGLAFG